MITKAQTPFFSPDVGYDESRLGVLNAHFERIIKAGHIQSANYCLSRYGKVFADAAVGMQSYLPGETRPLMTGNIRGVASVTKIFCATALFKLVEDGLIRCNQPVADILKEFDTPSYKDITIAHLLSHTSGLRPDSGCFPDAYYKNAWDYIRTMKDTPWLEAGLSIGMYNKPGKEWAYCSFGFVILGEIIRRVTGMCPEAFITKNIFEPCGMSDSGFWNYCPDQAEIERRKRLADRLYIQGKEDEEGYTIWKEGNGTNDNSPFKDVPMTGGGMFSTTQDLNKFGVMLMNKGMTGGGIRIIGRKTVERMTENYTAADIKDNCWGAGGAYRMYALGPDTRRTADCLYSAGTFFHEGAGACCVLVDPAEQMVASWFVPFATEQWYADALYNVSAVMWSGLK
jgi:serine-type D-Ala-D-Ala carboxypeptidase